MLLKLVLLLLGIVSSIAIPNGTIHLPIFKNERVKINKRSEVHHAMLYNNDGSEYLVNIGIGTPIQNFSVSLDTGSSDLWVPSTECSVEECPYSRFDPSKSSTFTHVNNDTHAAAPFEITYGIGSVRGLYAQDSVYLGNAHVPQQQFGLATNTSNLILNTSTPSNGILGLGYPALTTSKTKYNPFIFQLAEHGLIDQPIFSVSMGSIHAKGWSGEILLGGTNPAKYQGDIQYEPVFNEGENTYWMVGGRSVHIQKETTQSETILNVTFPSVRGTIIDTGTTLTYVDHELAEQIMHTIAGNNNNVVLDQMSGTYIVDCQIGGDSTTTYFVEFVMDSGTTLSVPVKNLILPLEDGLCMFGIAPWMSSGTSLKMDQKGWILIGDSVLRSSYLVFDMENHQIGFAKTSLVSHIAENSSSSNGNYLSPLVPFHANSIVTFLIMFLFYQLK